MSFSASKACDPTIGARMPAERNWLTSGAAVKKYPVM
jgi:hypothetical protein